VDAAAHEFLDINKADGRVLPGLTRRRQSEARLFLEEA
jgi:GH24 family phage-related lysozyme (muramidase)